MIRNVEAVYEHGVLRPLEPLSLPEAHRVTLTIADSSAGPSLWDLEILQLARVEAGLLKTIPTIEEVRSALSAIPGSLTDDVIGDRGDY